MPAAVQIDETTIQAAVETTQVNVVLSGGLTVETIQIEAPPELVATITGSGTTTVVEVGSPAPALMVIASDSEISAVEVQVPGLQGPPGTGGDKHYRHVQGAASATWVITHSLAKFPSVTIVDSGGNEVIGDVLHVSQTQLTIRFGAGFSGEAYLN